MTPCLDSLVSGIEFETQKFMKRPYVLKSMASPMKSSLFIFLIEFCFIRKSLRMGESEALYGQATRATLLQPFVDCAVLQ